MAGHASASVLSFDGFWLDRQGGGLFTTDQGGCLIPVALGSRCLELLDFLAHRGGEPVSKDEIMTIVWSGRVVEEANLNVQVSKLRHILDRDRPQGSCIQTINGFGYRFVAEVQFLDRSALSRFCQRAEHASPTAVNSGGAGCSRERAGPDMCGATDNVVRLGLPGLLARPAENEPQGARTTRGAEPGSFLINRLGAAGAIDPDLAAVLMELQQRLIDDYGDSAVARTLIDQVIAAYQDFIRLTGWIAHLSLMVEHELFHGEGGGTGRQANIVHANENRIDEPSAEQHLAQLSEHLLPLVERRGASVRELLGALEEFHSRPRHKTTSVLEPMCAELDQLSRKQRTVSSSSKMDGAQVCEAGSGSVVYVVDDFGILSSRAVL
jgi:DNA-binding winged helix-turn-helix (wHTH) protein